jgi:hypothetical protein
MNARTGTTVSRVSIVLALFAAACGGGGGNNGGPPPPPPKFTNASLSGQYAFSMSGTELCAGQGSLFARIGTFTADGHGNITSGLEDLNICTGTEILQFAGGKYSIDADGRGSLSLTNSSGTTNYSISLVSSAQGTVAQTDATVTSSGTFQRQNPASFSNAAIAGGYVFDFKGVEVVGTTVDPASIIGRFDADGAGAIVNGLYDSNVAGTLSGQQTFPTGTFYRMDTNGDGTAFGRGTANIAGRNFAFYVVDATRIKFIGTDFPSELLGEAFAQQNIAFNDSSLAEDYAFLIDGLNSGSPIATSGRFTADRAGNIASVVVDENHNGAVTLLPVGTVTGAAYAVDTNGFGGGLLQWTDTTAGTFSFIFYLISPTQAVLQETDSGIVSDGMFTAQTATPITTASMAGDYAFVWTGVNSSGDETDFAGQLALDSSGGFSGLLDSNRFATTTSTQVFDALINGNLTLSGNGLGANSLNVTEVSPADTFHFTAYIVDQNRIFVVCTDTNRVLSGTLTRQP